MQVIEESEVYSGMVALKGPECDVQDIVFPRLRKDIAVVWSLFHDKNDDGWNIMHVLRKNENGEISVKQFFSDPDSYREYDADIAVIVQDNIIAITYWYGSCSASRHGCEIDPDSFHIVKIDMSQEEFRILR